MIRVLAFAAFAGLLFAPLAAADIQSGSPMVPSPGSSANSRTVGLPGVTYECGPCPDDPMGRERCGIVVGGAAQVFDPLAPSCDCDYSCGQPSQLRRLLEGLA